jgi:hypothetical protein
MLSVRAGFDRVQETERTLMHWQSSLRRLHHEGLAALGGSVVTLDDTQLEFDFSSPIASSRKVCLGCCVRAVGTGVGYGEGVAERPRFESPSSRHSRRKLDRDGERKD